jgi:hypothetical protein
MTEHVLVRYGQHRIPRRGTACETCGSTEARAVTDHCHEHGWVRGLVCKRCNRLMALIDKRIAPRAESALLAALIALRNRCPDCDGLDVPDLTPAWESALTVRFPHELYEWLRREAFDTRESMNSIVVAAVEERRVVLRPRPRADPWRWGGPIRCRNRFPGQGTETDGSTSGSDGSTDSAGDGKGSGTVVHDTETTAVFPPPYVMVTDPGPARACRSAMIDTPIVAE